MGKVTKRKEYTLKCPKCNSTHKFSIDANVTVEVEGKTGYVVDYDGFEWDKISFCCCLNCYYDGEVSEFMNEK